MTFTVATSVWQLPGGLLGYTRHKWNGNLTPTEASSVIARHKTFFDALAVYQPTGVVIKHNALMDLYNDAGEKTGTVTATTAAADSVGSSSLAYNAAAGAWINWYTGRFVNGRQVVGRTFMVPMGSNAFQSDGTLVGAFQTALNNAASVLIGSTPRKVLFYSRTKNGVTSIGQADVTGNLVPDKGGVLRSRRD